jgi:uncharacterized protein
MLRPVSPVGVAGVDDAGEGLRLMPETFRFSPNPNRASEIAWRPWGPAAFAEATEQGRPVLLHLGAAWCQWCHLMDETTYSDPAVIRLLNDSLVPVRVDADRDPHVQDRYIAGGWPTVAFLTPTGEVLWSGTYTEGQHLTQVAASVLGAWRDRRTELEQEISRRQRAFEAGQGRSSGRGLVRREAADDVLTAMGATFDARNGGFGSEPKFPQPDAVELLYVRAEDDASLGVMADQTLDGMLAGELWDGVEGGFFRYATAADWTAPRREKLLEVNAALLEAYAQGAVLRDRDDWRSIARRIVEWVDGTLLLEGGLWGGSQVADPAYFAAGLEERRRMRPPPVETTLLTTCNARWIGALALAGARLGEDRWIGQAGAALDVLLKEMSAPGGGLWHYREPGAAPRHDFLLADTLECARASLAVAQATGAQRWVETARRLGQHMETAYWAESGGMWERLRTPDDVGALRYRERPFEANAVAARVLLELAQVTGERVWRALAERTLALLGPLAGRYGVSGASFALAATAFFDAPTAVFIVLPADASPSDTPVAALRRAAFALPVPALRVWTVPSGHASGPQRFTAKSEPAAYVLGRRGCTGPVGASGLVAALRA